MRSSPAAVSAAPAARSLHADAMVACPGCGHAVAWSALVRVQTLEGAALESQLAVPPDGWFVDVRACARCGRSLARKVRP
jgi:hypothetical protein